MHLWYENGAEEAEQPRVHAREGRTDATSLALPADTTAYLCGPLPFMKAVRSDRLAQ